MTDYAWHYRCGACGELVEVDDVREHVDKHRNDAGWTGHVSMTRVDKEPEK